MSVILTVNPGTSSKKFALHAEENIKLELRFEQSNSGCELVTQAAGTVQKSELIQKKEYDSAIEMVATRTGLFIEGRRLPSIEFVVVLVAIPGTFFQKHAVIDEGYIVELKKRESASLKVSRLLKEIAQLKKVFPAATIVAASDTAFYKTLPDTARRFSISNTDTSELDLYRFGKQGLSVSSVTHRIEKVIGQKPSQLVVCHIGSQVSVSAVKKGNAVDYTNCTSGFDVDSTALLSVMRSKNFRPNEAELYLKTSTGLLGMTGEADFRQLLARKAAGETEATYALNHYAYQLQKAIAASVLSVGVADAIVFTGTAAVRSPELRSLIAGNLSSLGIKLSQERNDSLVGKDGIVSERTSPAKIVVMKTDEVGELVRVVTELNLQNK